MTKRFKPVGPTVHDMQVANDEKNSLASMSHSQLRGLNDRTDELSESYKTHRAAGKSNAEIEAHHGVPRGTVQHLLQKGAMRWHPRNKPKA